MTKSEIVDAFIRGDLDRRGFIKRLTAVGVSSAAAMAYAGSLVQNAAATPSRHGAGFVMRAQGADADYGPTIPVEEIEEAVQAINDALDELVTGLSSLLDDFDASDFLDAGFEEGVAELLGNLLSQINEQIAALSSLFGLTGGASANAFSQSTGSSGGSLVERLTEVANGLNETAGMYAALIPSLEDVENRQLFTQIAIVAGRHAALVSYLVDIDPIPGAFEQPIDPTE